MTSAYSRSRAKRAPSSLVALLSRRELCPESMAPDDWDTVRAAAETHDLGALVYVRVKQHNVTLPPVVGDVLRASYVAGAARNMRLFDALGTILRSCETAGTPVIPLKGACLAERIYGDIALRPMADLDLLVKPADLPSAIERDGARHLSLTTTGSGLRAPGSGLGAQAGLSREPWAVGHPSTSDSARTPCWLRPSGACLPAS